MDLARELESFVRQAASDGESFDAVERMMHAQVLEIGRAALHLFVANQGNGDLGESVATPEGKRLTRSEQPVKRSICSVFGEITFNAFVYDRGRNTRMELRPVDARMELPAGKYRGKSRGKSGQALFLFFGASPKSSVRSPR